MGFFIGLFSYLIYNDVGIKDKRGDDYMDSKIAELKNIVAESNYIVFLVVQECQLKAEFLTFEV